MRKSKEQSFNDQIQDLLLKLPKDFDSLHTLEELRAQDYLSKMIRDNLDTYYQNYFNSHIKNKSQVLDYIPKSSWSKYFNNCMDRIDPKMWDLFGKSKKKPSKLEDLLDKDSYYIVNTIDKTIDVISKNWPVKTTMNYHKNKEKEEILVIVKYYERHSPFSRPPYDPIILDSWEEKYMFNIKRNLYIGQNQNSVSPHKYKYDYSQDF